MTEEAIEAVKFLKASGVKDVSECGARCAVVIEAWCGGLHHLESPHKIDWSHPNFTAIPCSEPLDTYDFDRMTRLVFLAHDHCIRVQISAGRGGLKLMFHPRQREGGMSQRHPGLEQAVAVWRKTHPIPVVPVIEHAPVKIGASLAA